MDSPLLQFQTMRSGIEASFWHELTKKKIEEFQLDTTPHEMHASYTTGAVEAVGSRVFLSHDAFAPAFEPRPLHYAVPGTLYLANTNEEFRTYDKAGIFKQHTQQIWDDIISGAALEDPSLLFRFFMLCFADLKKHRFHSLFAFPALMLGSPPRVSVTSPIADVLSTAQRTSLVTAYHGMAAPEALPPVFLCQPNGDSMVTGSLADWSAFYDPETTFVAIADPCGDASHPGWLLRNLLVLLSVHHPEATVLRVLCYRDARTEAARIDSSVVFHVHQPSTTDVAPFFDHTTGAAVARPTAVGWEKNKRGKVRPRTTDLAAAMDPLRLMNTSVDLNLKLMRWRLLPSLDLDTISQTRCLLLGSGTLGCNVARCLMGWGVRHITFLDNGAVSFSNPVRQSLFTFEDACNGGKPKAEAAAERVGAIFPGMQTRGVTMAIPMPGHAVTAKTMDAVRADVEALEQLFADHDAIFLLTDTRESRWLPSLLAAALDKPLINAAMGFDTFVVMRHGHGVDAAPSVDGNPITRSACYFCSDVISPGNSLADRTLDQQCTVTRPGLSYLTSAMAVELLIALLHHPLRHHAPAEEPVPIGTRTEHPLGLIPHQIRGFLTHFNNRLLASSAYDKCTACSQAVVETYRREGFDFLLRVFNEPSHLEDITGLTAMKAEMDAAMAEWDMDDDDDDEGAGARDNNDDDDDDGFELI